MTADTKKRLATASKRYAAAHDLLEGRRKDLDVAIRRAANRGASTREIASELGFSYQRIAQIVRGD